MPNSTDADLYQLIDDLPAMLATFDRHGRSAYRNHACSAFFGLGDDGESSEVNWISDLAFEENPEIRSRIDNGSEVRLVRELTGIDGMRRFEVSLIPSVSPSGEVHGYVAIARDAAADDETAVTGDGVASILESLPDGVLLYDAEGRLRYANSRFDAVWPSSEQPLEQDAGLDRTLLVVMQYACPEPNGSGPTGDLATRIANQGDAVTAVELEVAGRSVLCRINGTAAGGTMLSFSVIDQPNETGRTQYPWTEELIDAVARQMPGLIGQIDGDGRYVFANRAYSDWYGVAVDRIVGNTDSDMIARIPAPRLDEAWRRRRRANIRMALSGQTVEFEELRKYPDGHERYVRGALIPSFNRDGGVRGVSIVTIDISEEKRREKALSESEERYRNLAQLLPDAVRVVTDGKIVFANAAASGLLGVESPEHLSGFPGQYFLDPADREVTSDRMARVDRGENIPWREHSLRALGGEEVTVESAMAPIVWDGKPSRLLVSRDMSRHKLIESQLRQAMEESKQADVAKSRFLAAASHDLRQPIQALALLNAAMAYEVDSPTMREISSNMGHAIDAMRSVLDGLLDISKLEAGVVTPEFSVFPIAPLVDRIVGELSLEAQEKGIELHVVSSRAHVRSDRDLLERIVQNFASNAIRYTQSGRVLIGCRRRGDQLHLQIWDTGPGIEVDQQERIFEEFYQLENPARDRSKGLGLGLAIVDRLARLLGHSIEVRSEPDLGSMFSVVLPVEVDDGIVVDRRDPLPLIELDGKRILVLDDDEDVVEATMTLLSRWGAEVMGAHTADDAVRLATAVERTPDLVVVDYLLSGSETGIDVIRRLDEALELCVPRIVISGDVSTRIISEVRSAGSVLLHKPVNPAKLRSLIHHLLPSGN